MFPGVFFQHVSGFIVFSLLTISGVAISFRLLLPKFVSRTSWIRQRSVLQLLCFCWLVVLVYGQLLTHWIHACKFDESSGVKLLVIADPQLTDRFSYRVGHFWQSVIGFFCDLQLRISWKSAVWASNPDAAIILGDLIWGGFEYQEESEYLAAVVRLNSVFGGVGSSSKRPSQVQTPRGHTEKNRFDPSVPTMVICGNHDTW